MPKINTKDIRLHHAGADNLYHIDIWYESKKGFFYFKIPDSFKEIYSILSFPEKSELGIDSLMERGKYEYTYILKSDKESDLVDSAYKTFRKLLEKSISKRNVIILHLNKDSHSRFCSNKRHESICVEMGLCYAVETTVGSAKSYAIFEDWKGSPISEGNTFTINKDDVVIDDTSSNRKQLEKLYSAFVLLREKLAEIAASSDALTTFIESGVKLLN